MFESSLVSIKRWSDITPMGIKLPEGVYCSISRMEKYITNPTPSIKKIDYMSIMLPFGNVVNTKNGNKDNPIDEEWLFQFIQGDTTLLERLIESDRENPLEDWYELCNEWILKHEDHRFIHITSKHRDKAIKRYQEIIGQDQ